ncbi:MAG: hypothetical protein K2X72_04350 [Reyranella sp.]|nr:hypothetical protein [Reyranella sp.]
MVFRMPAAEGHIIWRYLDGVSQALARRFNGGSSPNEENLTFLLCELLDEGTTGLHLLHYPLTKAKEELAKSDGGVTLDVMFETHEHSKHVEHHFSGADLGVIFVFEHPFFGRSERAILLQAKRLFPDTRNDYTLKADFRSFHAAQRDFLRTIADRFDAEDAVFYLWYAPSSTAFTINDAKVLRSLEAHSSPFEGRYFYRHPRFGYIQESSIARLSDQEDVKAAWRLTQPATRYSGLDSIEDVTRSGRAPSIDALYRARVFRGRHYPDRWSSFEPFADLFLLAMQHRSIGHSSDEWLRLAKGEQVPLPLSSTTGTGARAPSEMPDVVPPPKHSVTFTLRSSLTWPEEFRLDDEDM